VVGSVTERSCRPTVSTFRSNLIVVHYPPGIIWSPIESKTERGQGPPWWSGAQRIRRARRRRLEYYRRAHDLIDVIDSVVTLRPVPFDSVFGDHSLTCTIEHERARNDRRGEPGSCREIRRERSPIDVVQHKLSGGEGSATITASDYGESGKQQDFLTKQAHRDSPLYKV
jgi:hypothetical protein